MNKKIRSLLYSSSIGIVIVFFDQLTKHWVLRCAHDMVVTPFLSITLVCNRGIPWGCFDSAGDSIFFVVVVVSSLVVMILATTAFYRWREGFSILGETMIIAGALSNIADRFIYGAVIDFIAFHYYGWEFAIFNIADFFIVLGILIMVVRNYTSTLHSGV